MADRTQQDNNRVQDTNALNQNQKIAQPVNAGQGASEQKAQGAMMLAKPGDNKLNVFKDPSNRKDKFTYATPLMIRVDYGDTKVYGNSTYVRVTEVPGQSDAYLGYALKSSIVNTAAAYKALDAVGITEKAERGVFMANAHNESGGGNTMNEKMGHTFESWRNVNRQTKAYASAYIEKYGEEGFQKHFKSWKASDEANYMYGIEGKKGAEALKTGIELPSKWKCDELGNTEENDGWRFRGRGAIQITGRTAFKDVNDQLNKDVGNGLTWYEQVRGEKGPVDIVKNPEKVGEDQFLGFLVSGLFWKKTCRRRIKNTAKKNASILKSGADVNKTVKNGSSVLDLIADDATAATVGRMSVSGETTDINNYGKNNSGKIIEDGLEKVTNDYLKNGAAYEMAYQSYKEDNGGVGNTAVSSEAQQTTTASQQTAQNESASSQTAENTEGSSQTTEFTAEEITEKRAWYAKKNYHRDFIIAFQKAVGTDADGFVGKNTVNKVAEWQRANNLKGDGLFGASSATKAGLTVKYNETASGSTSNQNQSGSQQNSGDHKGIDVAGAQDTGAGQAPAHGKGSGAARTHKLGSTTPSWCTSQGFANNTSLDSLSDKYSFKSKAKAVISAIRAAGAGVTITAVLRHPARAAMMAYARHFSDNKTKVSKACEILRDQYNVTVSGDATNAQAANSAFGVGTNPVGLNSNHIWGLAVDMSMSGLSKGKTIVVDGKKMTILDGDSPQDRLNATLKANNFSHFMWYGLEDKPHWSYNGK